MAKKRKLNVKQVTYSKLRNLGSFENERIECVVQVDSGDGSKELAAAKKWVESKLSVRTRYY